MLDRLLAIEEFEDRGIRDFDPGRIDAGAAHFVLKSRDQLLRMLESATNSKSTVSAVSIEEALGRALTVAYVDRLARRREAGSRRARMIGGRGVRLADSSAVTAGELFVCVEIDDSAGSEAGVRLASTVQRDWLPEELIWEDIDVQFDSERERVVAWKRVRIGDLVIAETEANIPRDVDAGEILAREAAARCDLQKLLDDETQQFIARVQCLAQWVPDLELPHWGDELMAELLPDLCIGRSSFAELREAPILPILRSRTQWAAIGSPRARCTGAVGGAQRQSNCAAI